MPAIDANLPTPSPAVSVGQNAAAELRPSGKTAAASAKSTAKVSDTDTQAGDAFIAALIAQSNLPQAQPAAPTPSTDGAAALAAGQELPAVRPALAMPTAVPRAASNANPAASASSDTAAAPLTSDGGAAANHDDFAAALVALHDAMTGGAGGSHGGKSEADTNTPGNGTPLPDVSAPTSSSDAQLRNQHVASHTLDAMLGAHAARTQELPAAAAYGAKPAALPMEQPALFAERLNQHISFMIGDQVQSAQIAVTPAELGPVEVRVTMVGDEAKIQLSAAHAATREALNEALPKLRASFADAGIAVSQAGVFAQMPQHQQANPSFSEQTGSSHERELERAPVAPAASTRTTRVGLIDAFV